MLQTHVTASWQPAIHGDIRLLPTQSAFCIFCVNIFIKDVMSTQHGRGPELRPGILFTGGENDYVHTV